MLLARLVFGFRRKLYFNPILEWPTAAVLGGIALLALLGIVVVLVYRRKRQR